VSSPPSPAWQPHQRLPFPTITKTTVESTLKMEKSNPETTAPQATLAQSPAVEPPAYYANPTTSPAPQGEIQLATPQQQPFQQDPIQQQPQQHIPDNYASKQAEAMNPNAVPLVTPVNMLQGETPQYIDCPWCYQRALVTIERHGSSMQMYAPTSTPYLFPPAAKANPP